MPAKYVYILQLTYRNFWCIITGQSLFKIGIAIDPVARVDNINKDLRKGKAVIIARLFFDRAQAIEKKMHRAFFDSRTTIKTRGKGQAGRTEWFYLTWLEILFCIVLLYWLKYRGIIVPAVALIAALIFYLITK
jgi:Flp pilus assembly protein TadB